MRWLLIVGLSLLIAACQPVVTVPSVTSSQGFDAQLNAFRSANGLSTLRAEPRLQAAAQTHAEDMLRRGYFSHRGPNGAGADSRIAAQGYRVCGWAENIASGQQSEGAVFQGWQKSAGHRRNMLGASYTEYGLAEAGNRWVLVLARPC